MNIKKATITAIGTLYAGLFIAIEPIFAQDDTRQDAINQATADARNHGFTKNQTRMWVALAKVDHDLFPNYDELEFDNSGNLLNGTQRQKDFVQTFNKLYKVIYPQFDENREYTEAELKEIEEKAYKKIKQFLNQLSPGLYTTLPTILFNSANMQNTQIQQRLWTMRMRAGQPELAPQVSDGGKTATIDNKKVVLPEVDPEKKWVAFVDGNGMWSQAQTVNNLPSYKTYAGGVQIGASREIVDGLIVGPYVGYQGTKIDFTGDWGGGSSATHNSVRFGLFGEYQLGGWYNDLIVGGAYNSIDVNHGINISGNGNTFRSMSKGTVSGGEFDLLYGTGYEFKVGNLTFGPATSFQYTYVYLGGTQETGGGVLDQKIGSQSTSSLLYTLGGQVSYNIDLTGSVRLQPLASLAWQHEFLQNGYDLQASILDQDYTYSTTNAGRDQFIAGVGFNLVFGKSVSAYAICNLINSDAKVFSQAVSGGINIKF